MDRLCGAEMKCEFCKYSRMDEKGLECRRYAPRPSGDDHWSMWPYVYPSDWCGEFELAAKKVNSIPQPPPGKIQ